MESINKILEDELKALNLKIDQLLETQRIILERLNQSPITTATPVKNIRITKEPKLKREEYYYQIIKHGYIVKKKI